jgi:N-methylhydantoinase A
VSESADGRGRVTASVDVGGTFTDVLVQRGRHIVFALKIPTTTRNPAAGVLSALNECHEGRIGEVVHATTLPSNALLSGRVEPSGRTALVTTRGFADVLEIGRQNRSELYNLLFQRPAPLVSSDLRYELETRSLVAGRVVARVRRADLRKLTARMKRHRIRSAAISFLNAYSDPGNERRVAEFLRKHLDYVSVSSEIAPEPREYERTSTTVVNAILMPVVSDYLQRLEAGLRRPRRTRVSVMSSAGGLVSVAEAHRKPVQTLESGPAAGVIAAAALARLLRLPNVISFDMGGTTAKAGTVSGGVVETTSELEVGGTSHHGRKTKGSGYPVRFPFVDLVEVSAGGGTVISMDPDGALAIGPGSAGSEPGPACYGRGGTEPTLTDANLVTGILGNRMLGGEMRLDPAAAQRSLRTLGDPERVAAGALRLADLEMSRAIRLVTVERGLDPTDFTLVAFGGAGPQHAAHVAQELGIPRVVVPPRPGLFSAWGLLCSDWKFETGKAFPTHPSEEFALLQAELRRRHGRSRFLRTADCRYVGQGSELTIAVPHPDRAAIEQEFERVHQATFGFRLEREVEIVMIRVFAISGRSKPAMAGTLRVLSAVGRRDAWIDGRRTSLRTLRRDGLSVGASVRGPACVESYDSTIFVPPGWHGSAGGYGEFQLRRETE